MLKNIIIIKWHISCRSESSNISLVVFFCRIEDIDTKLFSMPHVSSDPPISGNSGFILHYTVTYIFSEPFISMKHVTLPRKLKPELLDQRFGGLRILVAQQKSLVLIFSILLTSHFNLQSVLKK